MEWKHTPIDGNNVLEVYNTIASLRNDLKKKSRPILLECMTFRMRGHEEASGTKYVPQELMDEWAKKDPLENFEQYLKLEKVLTDEQIEAFRADNRKINDGSAAFSEESVTANTVMEMGDMYKPYTIIPKKPETDKKTNKRFVDAVSDDLRQSMQKYDKSVVMGQDVAEYGGVFKITDGFIEEFGKAVTILLFANRLLLVRQWDCLSMATKQLWKCNLLIL